LVAAILCPRATQTLLEIQVFWKGLSTDKEKKMAVYALIISFIALCFATYGMFLEYTMWKEDKD
jgi:hypothetical protein